MGLSPRSLAHALRLNVESPRLRLRRTESGARALHFEAPPAREAPRSAEAEPPADASTVVDKAPAPGRRRFIDDAEEVGWRQGLVRAARDGLEHYIPDAKRAPLFEEAFGPLESVRVMGETGFEDLPALRLTPDVRGQVLRGRMRFGDKGPDAGRGGVSSEPRAADADDVARRLITSERAGYTDDLDAPRERPARPRSSDPAVAQRQENRAQRRHLTEMYDEYMRAKSVVRATERGSPDYEVALRREEEAFRRYQEAAASQLPDGGTLAMRSGAGLNPGTEVAPPPPGPESIGNALNELRELGRELPNMSPEKQARAQEIAQEVYDLFVDMANWRETTRRLLAESGYDYATGQSTKLSVVLPEPERPNGGALDDFPKFGASGGPSKPGAGPYAIERAVRAAWGETGAALLDSGVLTVVRQPANMTGTVKIDGVDTALKDFADDIPDWVGAVHVGDKAILFADRLAPERVRYLVLHEIGVHYGLESMIGKRRYTTLKRQAAARAAKAVAAARAARDAGAKEIDPGDLFWLKVETRVRAHYDVKDPAYGDELLAYAAEDAEFQLKNFADNHPDRAWWQKILDAVRRWAATQFGVGAITARDVHTLAVASLRRVGRMAADAQAEPIGPMAYVAVGDVMRFAEREGWDGQGGASGARAFLESEGRAGAYERDYRKAPKPGSRGAANAAAATASAGVAASSAVGAATAVKSNQNQAEARQAEYERLLAEDEARQEREAQQAAERAEREERERALAERDFDALPQMDTTTLETRAAWLAEAVEWVGQWSGVDPDYLKALVTRETAGTLQPAIRPVRGGKLLSQALGLGQFIPDTWAFEMERIGTEYGVDLPEDATRRSLRQDEAIQALRENPTLALAIAGEHQMENARFMEESLGRPINAAEAYAAHFFGRDKALVFLEGVRESRDAAWMAQTFSSQIKANPFLEGQSAAEVMAGFETDFPGASPYSTRPTEWAPLSQSPAPEAGSPTPE